MAQRRRSGREVSGEICRIEGSMREYSLDVPGGDATGAEWSDVRSPYSGEPVGRVQLAGGAGMARAISVASGAFRDRNAWLPGYERAAILIRLADRIAARTDELAALIALEGGKPLTYARAEVVRAANTVRLCAEEATRIHGEEIPMAGSKAAEGRLAFTTREPIGGVAAISAFNHPLNLIAHQAGPAFAAGCPVLVKPDTRTPLSCAEFVSMLHEAGAPREWAMAVPCRHDVAEQLATSADIGFLSFIGSAKVGWYLRSMLAPGVRCALEHGGAAPVIVDETADLEKAVPQVLKGGFYHAGQVCVSVQRIFAQRSIKDDLVSRLVAGAKALRVGDPSLLDTEVGPIIDDTARQRIHDWITEVAAHVACGGRMLDNHCYEPTVIVDPPLDSKMMTQELFGPAVCVCGYETLDEAIGLCNSVEGGFQSSIMTRDVERAMVAARGLNASAVMINDHTAFRVDWMPFGGRGPSGLGMGGVPSSVHDMTQEKLIVLRG
jgi:acyl-CoA reductase-like NAD-dependent aldehyde dehydrogenase